MHLSCRGVWKIENQNVELPVGKAGLNCESPLYFETEYQIFLFKKELKNCFYCGIKCIRPVHLTAQEIEKAPKFKGILITLQKSFVKFIIFNSISKL